MHRAERIFAIVAARRTHDAVKEDFLVIEGNQTAGAALVGTGECCQAQESP